MDFRSILLVFLTSVMLPGKYYDVF